MFADLEIVFMRQGLVAINKPHGLLVHRSPIAGTAEVFALQMLRNRLGVSVYPAHRLDRKTAGVLLFTTSTALNSLMQQAFMNRQVEKVYHAVVRGWIDDEGTIDYPLKDERGRSQEAYTTYRCIHRSELPIPSAGFSTSRYSLVEVVPLTGRMHQIRRHFAHIFHPVIGDVKHGCNKQNRLLRRHMHLDIMLLHACSLRFLHPSTANEVYIEAPYQPPYVHFARQLGFSAPK
ncbi:MAG TPA: pseudouridine synthase [Bacteroidales bacterium]|nr:pseudouridine synthase [Bacteroidales bacterium]